MNTQGSRKKGDYYPLFLNLKGKNCLVVGGGGVALRKVNNLLDYGASVTVISPTFCAGLKQLAEAQIIHVSLREFAASAIPDSFLVIAATNNPKINRRVAAEARKHRVLVNVVDDARLSDFIFPALLSRGDLTIAISSGGKSPALSRKVRDHLEQYLEKEYSTLIEIVAEVRVEFQKRHLALKKETWQNALDIETLINLIRGGQKEKARSFLMDNLVQPAGNKRK